MRRVLWLSLGLFLAVITLFISDTTATEIEVHVLQIGTRYIHQDSTILEEPYLMVQYGTVPSQMPITPLEMIVGTYLANGEYYLPRYDKSENGWICVTFRELALNESFRQDISQIQVRNEHPSLPEWYTQLPTDLQSAINRFLVFEEGFFVYLNNESDARTAEKLANALRHYQLDAKLAQ